MCDRGCAGPTGYQGKTGPTGSRGPAGPPGQVGPRGSANNVTGGQGPVGPRGPTPPSHVPGQEVFTTRNPLFYAWWALSGVGLILTVVSAVFGLRAKATTNYFKTNRQKRLDDEEQDRPAAMQGYFDALMSENANPRFHHTNNLTSRRSHHT